MLGDAARETCRNVLAVAGAGAVAVAVATHYKELPLFEFFGLSPNLHSALLSLARLGVFLFEQLGYFIESLATPN